MVCHFKMPFTIRRNDTYLEKVWLPAFWSSSWSFLVVSSRNSSQNKMSLIFWRNEILFGHFDKLVNAQVYKSRCCSFKALQLAMIYITVKASLYRKRIDHDDQDDHCTRISWTTSRHTWMRFKTDFKSRNNSKKTINV